MKLDMLAVVRSNLGASITLYASCPSIDVFGQNFVQHHVRILQSDVEAPCTGSGL